jgi:hypothetical protein
MEPLIFDDAGAGTSLLHTKSHNGHKEDRSIVHVIRSVVHSSIHLLVP